MTRFKSSIWLAVTALTLLSCGNPGKPSVSSLIYMPPDQFLHPFPGTIIVSDLTAYGTESPAMLSAQVISNDALKLHVCQIQLPPEEKIDRKFRKCLFLVGLGTCNGAADVDSGPEPRVIPPGYERTCSDYWSEVYDRLKPNPATGRD